MKLGPPWDKVSFHDARVLSARVEAKGVTFALESIALIGPPVSHLDSARLIFTDVSTLSVQGFRSHSNESFELTPDEAKIETIAEVTQSGPDWIISGFRPDGVWVEWKIKGIPSLESP